MSLDTRDLIETRDELKQQILDSFLDEFPQYEDITDNFEDIKLKEEEIESWAEEWLDELNQIREINELEEEVNDYSDSNFEYGVILIEEDGFSDYCEDFVKDCYRLEVIPEFIKDNINWDGVTEYLKVDYTEVEYQGTTYLFN